MSENWMTVDPGISGTGIACFSGNKLEHWQNIFPPGKTWQQKALNVVNVLEVLDYERSITKMFCEWPSFQNTVALNTGSILKLTYLIGGISQKFGYNNLIPVVQWKGQLKKEITKLRAERFFKQKGFKSHAADAVALGQYVIQEGLI